MRRVSIVYDPVPNVPDNTAAAGTPVTLVIVPDDGVPNAPPFVTKAPEVPTFTARAVATPVPNPVTDPIAGVTVVFDAAVTSPLAFTVTTLACVADPKVPTFELTAARVEAFPTEVTSPVRLAFVVTVPAVSPAAVPVRLVAIPDAGVPNAGAVSTGEASVLFVRVWIVVLSIVTEVSIAMEFPVIVIPFPEVKDP